MASKQLCFSMNTLYGIGWVHKLHQRYILKCTSVRYINVEDRDRDRDRDSQPVRQTETERKMEWKVFFSAQSAVTVI